MSLGDPISPLVRLEIAGVSALAKLDFVGPTGSFKDRLASLIVTRLAHWRIPACIVDSSGNAGIACAAYCARAGISCTVYVPSYTNRGKIALMAAYGAEVQQVDGSREDVSQAALTASERVFYGGQTRSPFFRLGGYLWAIEVFGALGKLPDAVVLPTGSGSLLLGAAKAFGLIASRRSVPSPRLYAIQSSNCAPLADAFERGLTASDDNRCWQTTIAEGIATARPLRSSELLAAVRASGGAVASVGDAAIGEACSALGAQGFCVEPTAAAGVAAIPALVAAGALVARETIVVALTGSGQKTLRG